MTTRIDSKNIVTPFQFAGCTIRAVSGDANPFGRKYEPTFQVCGAVWGDGSYTRSALIEAGAIPEELDRIFAAAIAEHDAFTAAL